MRPLGTSSRTQTVRGERVAPIQHACTSVPWSQYGKTHRALCGRQVYVRHGETFDPTHPRACPKCKSLTEGETR